MNWESTLIVLAVGIVGVPLVHFAGLWATKPYPADRKRVYQVDAILAATTLIFALIAGVA